VTKQRRVLVLLLWVASLPGLAHAKQFAIVADKANPTSNLTATELVKIFTAHSRSWADGKAITVVMRDPSAADMQLVLRKLMNMTPEQAHAFVLAHRDAIMVADSDDAVLRFVSTSPGAIGIVDLYSLTQDVRVVKVDGKLPVEQGYFLRGN
jgi:ABC-type phosphate transport system substrate-binding protein